MTNTLKPCPFCGGEATIAQTDDNHGKWYVQCKFGTMNTPKCPASRIVMWDYKNKDEAIEAWNRRSEI